MDFFDEIIFHFSNLATQKPSLYSFANNNFKIERLSEKIQSHTYQKSIMLIYQLFVTRKGDPIDLLAPLFILFKRLIVEGSIPLHSIHLLGSI